MKNNKIILFFISICLLISIILNIILLNKNEIKLDENVVFFGDSITNKYSIKEFFPSTHVINSGISGNKSEDLIERIDIDVYDYNPSKVFLLIGINDLNNNVDENEILNNIQKIINGIKSNRKNTKIYIESIYPINRSVLVETNYSFDESISNETIINFNKKLKNLCKENNITYINVYNELLDNDGNLKSNYTIDGLHLNDLGYFKVTRKLEKYI